ncbi:hypothetical protein ECANGB1_917 [Enterospora canceri]|uniref:Uncharacterized protein n=1 Tax=Enterospora canceri TaxID=1081671 RepID=A0A1Y1S784_9MICR|nr:hypothetical protein ECANGB1_917 [Enterospora canceri]
MDLDKNEVSEVSSKQLEKLLKNIDVKPRLLNPVIGNQNGINFKSESNLNMKMVENLTKNIVEMQRQRISSVGLTETSKVVQNNYNNIEKTRNELEELFGGLFPNAEKTDRMMMVYSLLSVLYRSKETSFLAKYLEEIKYPKFEVKETKKEEQPVRKKMFKVFDLSKLKKK